MSEEKATCDVPVTGSKRRVLTLFYTNCGVLGTQIGVIASIGVTGDWAAYIGANSDTFSTASLELGTAHFGNKLPEDIARAFAKSAGFEDLFKDRKYRE